MLNTAVPFEVPTVHSNNYTYPASPSSRPYTPSSGSGSVEWLRLRQGSALPARIAAENEHCITLAEPFQVAPPVIVFFSFLDEESKKWAVEHQVAQNIRRNVPQDTTVSRYHAPMRFAWILVKVLLMHGL